MNYIICTSLIREKARKNNIYLGFWALNNDNFLSYRNKKINKFIWANKNKFVKDSLYIKKICLRLYRFLYLSLNKTHQSQFSIKFWKILLFPWLYYYISGLYFRWNTVKEIKKNNYFIFEKNLKINNTNYLEDLDLLLNDQWNQKTFQEIALEQKKKYIFQKKLNNKEYYFKKNTFYINYINFFFVPNFLFIFFNYLFSLLKTNKVLFINTGYHRNASFALFRKYKLNSSLEFFLKKLNPLFVYSGKQNYDLRKKFKNLFSNYFLSKSKFEIYLKEKISEDLPNYLLEDFKNYLNRYIKINNSKIIITAYDLFSKFPNKFYIAEQVNKGAKLYLLEHGGSLSPKKAMLDLDLNMVDKKITWHKPLKFKEFQIPTHPFYFNKLSNKNIDYKKNTDCILIGGGDFKHIWNSEYFIKPPQIIEQLEDIKKLYNCLRYDIKKRIFIKPHKGYSYSSDITFDLSKFYKKIFNKRIISDSSVEDCIARSKLAITVYPMTTFSLLMYSSIPTVLIFNKKHYIFDDEVNVLIKKLVKNKIIFYDPKSAANHINNIWNDPEIWFNSENVKKARNLFLKEALGMSFPRDENKEEKKWVKILN
jgi:putative transferase (TIGR04331 family)